MPAQRPAKKHSTALIVVMTLGVVGVGAGLVYMYQKKKKAAAASSSALSSSAGTGYALPVMSEPLNPQNQPNSYASTPTIQNYVSQPTYTSSTQSTTFFGSPPWVHNYSPPHAPHMTPHDHQGRGR